MNQNSSSNSAKNCNPYTVQITRCKMPVPKPFFLKIRIQPSWFDILTNRIVRFKEWSADSCFLWHPKRQGLKTKGQSWSGEAAGRKMPPFPKTHFNSSARKFRLKQCPEKQSLERQLTAGVSKPFRLLPSSSLLIDISLICDNQITILPDFLPH